MGIGLLHRVLRPHINYVRLGLSGDQTITTGTDTLVNWAVEDEKQGKVAYTLAAEGAGQTVTIGETGIYIVQVHTDWNITGFAATGQRMVWISKNGGGQAIAANSYEPDSGDGYGSATAGPTQFNSGDVLRVFVRHEIGSDRLLQDFRPTFLTLWRLGPVGSIAYKIYDLAAQQTMAQNTDTIVTLDTLLESGGDLDLSLASGVITANENAELLIWAGQQWDNGSDNELRSVWVHRVRGAVNIRVAQCDRGAPSAGWDLGRAGWGQVNTGPIDAAVGDEFTLRVRQEIQANLAFKAFGNAQITIWKPGDLVRGFVEYGLATTQTIPHAGGGGDATLVDFDTLDRSGGETGWLTANGDGTFTFDADGTYLLFAGQGWAVNDVDLRRLEIYHNVLRVAGDTRGDLCDRGYGTAYSGPIRVVVGDTCKVQVRQNSGGDLVFQDNRRTFFKVVRLA